MLSEITQLLEMEIKKTKLSYENQIEELKNNSDYGAVGDMKWLEERLSMSKDKITETILYPFRKELEGKAVYYPESRGKPWRFNKHEINQWIAENFERIDW